jgi:hypothetical protein
LILPVAGEADVRRELRSRLEATYLEHISLHLRSRDPDGRPLRTYIDAWFAYFRGGPLVTQAGCQQWMNTGDLASNPALADYVHAISEAAHEQLQLGQSSRLVKDHTVPKAYVCARLFDLPRNDPESIRQCLRRWYTVSILTKAEHARLGTGGGMPSGWEESLLSRNNLARFARYKGANPAIRYRLLRAYHDQWG